MSFSLGEESKIKLGVVAFILPVIASGAFTLAVVSVRGDVFEKRLDYNTAQRDITDEKIDHIREDVAEIKGILKQMNRHKGD